MQQDSKNLSVDKREQARNNKLDGTMTLVIELEKTNLNDSVWYKIRIAVGSERLFLLKFY